jgi:hypothetical protein
MTSASRPAEPADQARSPVVRRGRGHVKSSATDRTCSVADCETALSRYNHGTLCWLHATEVDDEARRGRS